MIFDLWFAVTHPGDARVRAAAVSGARVHPGVFLLSAFLPQRALPVLNTPAALEAGVGLQTQTTALPQRVALIQVRCRDQERFAYDLWTTINSADYLNQSRCFQTDSREIFTVKIHKYINSDDNKYYYLKILD